jgi:hypothetical protein
MVGTFDPHHLSPSALDDCASPGSTLLTPSGVVSLSSESRARLFAPFVVAASLLLAACGSSEPPGAAASPSPTLAAASPAVQLPAGPPPSASPTANTTGFAFGAEDIAAYYQSKGYVCASPQPSTKAAGFTLRTCQVTDDAGRTRTVGLVTDPTGGLANGFASVKGKEAETILAPIDALDPLSGFLGATLGEEQGAALLTWLASHLGDAYAETTSGPINVATYSESVDDHSTLYVEVANQAYLGAPPPVSP